MGGPISKVADVLSWSEIHEGLDLSFPFVITKVEMDAFAELSGDHNPMHRDADFARAKGFDGPVVYGALIVAQVSRLIGMYLPGRDATWTGLKIEFRAPLMIDQEAQLTAVVQSASDAVRMIKLSLKVTVGDKVIAKGKAEVVVR